MNDCILRLLEQELERQRHSKVASYYPEAGACAANCTQNTWISFGQALTTASVP